MEFIHVTVSGHKTQTCTTQESVYFKLPSWYDTPHTEYTAHGFSTPMMCSAGTAQMDKSTPAIFVAMC